MAVIGGNTVYHNPLKFSCVPESFLGGISIRSKMVWVSSIVFMNLVWCGAVASQLLPLLLEGLNGGVHLSVKIHLLCR